MHGENEIYQITSAGMFLNDDGVSLMLDCRRPDAGVQLMISEEQARELAHICDIPLNTDVAVAFTGKFLTINLPDPYDDIVSLGDPFGKKHIDLMPEMPEKATNNAEHATSDDGSDTEGLDGNEIWRVVEASFVLGKIAPILKLTLQRQNGIATWLSLREDMARKLATMCDIPLDEDAAQAFVGTYLTVKFSSTLFERPTSIGNPYGETLIDLT